MYDYVQPMNINISTPNKWNDEVCIKGSNEFYLIINGGFKLLINDQNMKE